MRKVFFFLMIAGAVLVATLLVVSKFGGQGDNKQASSNAGSAKGSSKIAQTVQLQAVHLLTWPHDS